MSGKRFDYIRYDEEAQHVQETFKADVSILEEKCFECIHAERPREYALKALEEFYMWVGKGIRDDQIKRNGGAQLQESRGE